MREPRLRIVAATFNKGKFEELRTMLSKSGVEVLSLADFPEIPDVEETGATFAENAELKAVTYAKSTGQWTLSDDSGLEVEALGGAPGVRSARYAGEGASDSQRVEKLLTELTAVQTGSRAARFVCAVALADPEGVIRFRSEGECRGTIAETPLGKGGFGYDPIFIPEGHSKTFGELPQEVKDQLSHRARALQKIIAFLADF